ncbi:MAG: DUF58 domain-containing protein [Ruminococcaceae bacterium]|nr:DUF58 domain-containing protein [Oscillospiraceae bacterium]
MRAALRRTVYILVLLICTVFYTFFQKWMAYIFFLTVVGLPWLSLLISLPMMLKFRVHIEAPESVHRGTTVHARLVGDTRFPMPLFSGKLAVRRMTDGKQWTYPQNAVMDTAHCGTLEVAARRVWVYDYLGLIAIPVRQLPDTQITVRPIEVAMPMPAGIEQLLARSWRPRPGGGYSEHHEMREYRPGDALNQIHWKLTAKTGTIIIREPMQPDRGAVLLTLEIAGDADVLDRVFGRLLYFGNYLLSRGVSYGVCASTAKGQLHYTIALEDDLVRAIDTMLCVEAAKESTRSAVPASRQIYIGGEV